MRMGRAELMRRSVRSSKCDRDVELSTRHCEHIWRVVYNLVERDERKTECHKLDNRAQSDHRRSHAETGESVFTDWGVDDAPWPKALEQPLAHFVSAIVFGDLFAHKKDIRVALQFLRERFVERLTIRNFPHPVAAVSAASALDFAGDPPSPGFGVAGMPASTELA